MPIRAMHRRVLLTAPIVLVANPSFTARVTVTIDNFTFTPERLEVSAGTQVMWINHDDIPHTIVHASRPPAFRSRALDTEEHFINVFDTPGTYAYFCGLHPHMTGMIVVT